MNKLTFIPILFLLACSPKKSETDNHEFEGLISYSTEISTKSSAYSNKQLEVFFGDSMTLYVKGNNYKMVFNGQDIQEIIYLGDSNKQYSIRRGIDSLFVGDCSIEKHELIFSDLVLDTLIVLGRPCVKVSNKVGPYIFEYWFDKNLGVKQNQFKDHEFGHLNSYFKKSNSWYLQYSYEGELYELKHSAVNIQETDLDESEFNIPELPRTKFE